MQMNPNLHSRYENYPKKQDLYIGLGTVWKKNYFLANARNVQIQDGKVKWQLKQELHNPHLSWT